MNNNIFKLFFGVALLAMAFTSCSENIDESARYTFKNQTVTDYVRNNAQYSEYAALIDQILISTHSQSKVAQLLSARGNFVVFAPTNDAISRYLDTVKEKGIIPASVKTIGDITDEVIADSLKRVIVYNSIVDFSEYQSVFQYISDIAPQTTQDSKTMVYSNMNNRFLKVSRLQQIKVPGEGGDSITIDSYPVEGAHIFKADIQVYNGIIHEMYEVVAPSNDDLIDVLGKSPQLSAFSELIGLCGLSDTLKVQEDDLYHNLYWSNPDQYKAPTHKTQGSAKSFEYRLVGFTAFIETNDVYKDLGLLNAEGHIDLDALRQYLASRQPAGLSQGDDYEDENNWLNFFVTYHLLPMAIEYDYLLIHYNELGYLWSNPESKPTITQHEHYTTMGKPRLLNISEGSDTVNLGTKGKRLNYFASIYRSYTNPFTVQEQYSQGILIQDPTTIEDVKLEEPVNAKIYPIRELLVYTPQIAKWQGTMRMRFDVTSLFPELMTNHIRRRYNNIGDYGFTKNYPYLANMSWSDESNVYYFPGYGSSWHNYQGDEFNITGIYDIFIKLPPIPYSTTYELRVGVSVNPTRGMMQVYFGTNKNALPAAGIPLDMRMGGVLRYQDWNGNRTSNSNVGWEEDGDDYQYNDEVDKKMRLQGFMKAPAGFAKTPVFGAIDVKSSMRNNCESYGTKGNALRRIVVRQEMQEGETYYIRFKDVLGNPNSQFFLDYFELVPKEVYDNPINPEDIW
ncbi:MAG: fasciclin domain-containing protein [Bacteroidaceae bacterium]|nr:fasciclin domain-containing protein [Bacteroidaceae bacterium]